MGWDVGRRDLQKALRRAEAQARVGLPSRLAPRGGPAGGRGGHPRRLHEPCRRIAGRGLTPPGADKTCNVLDVIENPAVGWSSRCTMRNATKCMTERGAELALYDLQWPVFDLAFAQVVIGQR